MGGRLGLSLLAGVPGVLVGVGAGLSGLVARLCGQLLCLAPSLGLDVAGAVLGGLDDRPHPLGGGRRDGCASRLAPGPGALELLHGLCDLAEVAVDFVRVITPARGREIRPLDELTLQLQASSSVS